ncbi:MAG: T9SS type A sorting domain-containing protein [Flavobacteriales bacterium]
MSNAQQRVDIQLNRADDGTQQVLLIPAEDFDGLLSNLVITLVWDSTRCQQPPILRQTPEQSSVLPLSPSGPAFSNGAQNYRKYTGVGLVPLNESTMRMQAGKSLCIARIDGDAGCPASISDAPWLRERRHNGAFYISLNGHNKTGSVIQSGIAAVSAEGPALSISPNPYSGGPLSYSINAHDDGQAQVTMQDARGRRVGEWLIAVRKGSNTGTLSPSALAAGSYTVRVFVGTLDATVPLAVTER